MIMKEVLKKYFKKIKFKTIIELELVDYDKNNLYIVLGYLNKKDICKCYWINLNLVNKNNYLSYLNTQIVDNNLEQYLNELFNQDNIIQKYVIDNNSELVNLNIYLNSKNYNYIFYKYLPLSLEFLVDIFKIIFAYLPYLYHPFNMKILSLYYDTNWLYEYKKTFDFDLFNDNIDDLFEERIIERGLKYFNDNKIEFLEKIDSRYFAIVNGTNSNRYNVIIDYDENEKKLQVFCNCPCKFYCKHIYAVLVAIRNNINKRFYKIMYRDDNMDLYDKIVNFKYLLCIKIIEDNFEIINKYGEIELIPILNRNWVILEDDDNRSLANDLESVYHKKNI